MKYVVAGVGYTGRRVCSKFSGSDIVCLNRTAVDGLPDGATILRFDLDATAPRSPQLPSPCTILYTVPPRAGEETDGRLANFLSQLATPVHRFVYLSTSGVYGNRDGARVTEVDSPKPATDRARRRVAAEKLLNRWCAENHTELIVLRVPGIYGPSHIGLERIAAGEPVLLDSESSPGNRIHVDDLATCCFKALTEPLPTGIYNLGDGDHRSSTWFSQTVASILQLPPLPEVPLSTAMEKFAMTRLSFLVESRIVDTTKMREVMGFTPRYSDPIDGIMASLAE